MKTLIIGLWYNSCTASMAIHNILTLRLLPADLILGNNTVICVRII